MRQLMAFHVPEQKPTPTVAPVMHCVVEMGSPSLVAMMTVMAAPNSMENPRLGECRVRRLPNWRIILYPYVQRPMAVGASVSEGQIERGSEATY